MVNDFKLLFDTIKDPRDLAEVLHLAIATGREVDITGKSIRHDHKKVAGIIGSWKPGFKDMPMIFFQEYLNSKNKVIQLLVQPQIQDHHYFKQTCQEENKQLYLALKLAD